MPGSVSYRFHCRWTAGLIGVLALHLAGCQPAPAEVEAPDLRRVIRVSAGLGEGMAPVSKILTDTLTEHFPVEIQVQNTRLVSNARLIEESEVEVAIIPSNIAYLAYTQGWGELPRPHQNLRGIAVLYTIPLHLITITTDQVDIQRISDIRGKRIAIGVPGSTTELTVTMTLEGLGLALQDIEAHRISGDEAVAALRTGRVDAVFNRGSDPLPTVQQLIQIPGARFIPIMKSEIDAIRSRHSFLQHTAIPAGTYGDHPDTGTIGVHSLMVCRSDLPEELVYWITRGLLESMNELVGPSKSQYQINLEQVQATPIPLHPGAARYYRERELFH